MSEQPPAPVKTKKISVRDIIKDIKAGKYNQPLPPAKDNQPVPDAKNSNQQLSSANKNNQPLPAANKNNQPLPAANKNNQPYPPEIEAELERYRRTVRVMKELNAAIRWQHFKSIIIFAILYTINNYIYKFV